MSSFPTQGCSSGREYLAVQGPDKLTMEDFWTLVWEQDVHTILTLLPWQEKGEVRCRACLCHGSNLFNGVGSSKTGMLFTDASVQVQLS